MYTVPAIVFSTAVCELLNASVCACACFAFHYYYYYYLILLGQEKSKSRLLYRKVYWLRDLIYIYINHLLLQNSSFFFFFL